MGTLELTTYHGAAAVQVGGTLVDLYRSVFTAQPWNEDETRVEEFRARLARDVDRPGFQTAVAHVDGRPIGFGTAWRTQQPFPTNRAYRHVLDQLGPNRVEFLLVGALEVDELAVVPAAQGRGIGGQIVDTLLEAAPDRRAWLLTWATSPQAVRFYQLRGWRPAHLSDDQQVVVFLAPGHPGQR